MPKVRVFLAEDHAIVREGLKLLIENQPDMEVAGEAGDGQAVLEHLPQVHPDVIVLDVSMPGLSGMQVAQQLSRSGSTAKILALSVHEDGSYLREMLEAGASGYVLKRSAAEDLIFAIHTVMQGGVYLDPVIAGQLIPNLAQGPDNGKLIKASTLSQRESEVLRLIAHGFSNKEIAHQLDVSIKTVETYKARAMGKTGLHNRADIVRYAVSRDWLRD